MMTATPEQVENLRDLFLKKVEKDPPPCEGGLHPKDIERAKTSDRWVQLFLEQCDLDMKQSLKMMWETCIWRRTYGTNEISEKNVRLDYLEAGLIFPHNVDVEGKILLIFKSKLHTKGSRDVTELIRCLVYWIERLHRKTNYDQLTLFFDMQSAGLGNMDMDFTKRIIDTFKLYYPNSLNFIIIFEMPWVLSAAFKIIKTLLPPKAVARMKFVNSKTMKEFITEENMLENWGGTDKYEFKFAVEQRQENGRRGPDSPGGDGAEINTSGSSIKKVHFATPSPPESPMSEVSGAQLIGGSDGELLLLKPEDAITFSKKGSDWLGTVEITNGSRGHVTYKIKTTSPDKFRVRPSAGVLPPTGKSIITVILQQGHEYSTLAKDKFLVMCMAIDEDMASNDQQIAELWKNTPSGSPIVEQHRLKCTLPQSAQLDGIKNGKLSSAMQHPGDSDREIYVLNNSLMQLNEVTTSLNKQIKFMQKLQWLTIIIFTFLCVAMYHFLKQEPECVIAPRSEL